ncbi:hypothetical protein CARUB_v10022945mg [Capsella rubella]|uniref:Clp R domain-containing protein n=1 Tax=Capsella rubella TaxID=81985 RepID=R0FV94_9BRAS|nr:protein SMAX1-LIKE 3 [Capsella rubella]EOA26852.1 hypothetical protein CARUB_v10022945mg [Capsella rubella]
MRSGGYSVQQALTPEAATMVKQAMALARLRGHAQVTPLHVANTMLSASMGLLRTACLQSHTHPLQCRALELCFNVSLNRLPTSTGSPMLVPCISNSLAAAFKRAQAHQRRGFIESQQHPILVVKIEPEQLIISILDDPGVSRVMREAGFSSPQVKNKVEQAVSLKICSNKSKAKNLLTAAVKNFSEIENETILECSTVTDAEGKRRSSNVITALPAWLQQYKKENQQKDTDSDNSICNLVHKRTSEKTIDLSSLSPSSSSCNTYVSTDANLRLFAPEHNNDLTTTLLMNSAASSSDAVDIEYVSRFKEMNVENLETLCDALSSKAPRQKDVIPDIARAILKCRSGSTPRKIRNGIRKEETWLFFQGVDVESKEKIGRELAKLVFGSVNSFVPISLSSFSSSSMEDLGNKRRRDGDSWNYIQRLFEAVSCDPHRVFFVEDIEEADYLCHMSFKKAIERGKLQSGSGEEAFLKDAIVILSCERFSSRSSRPCSPSEDDRKMRSPCVSLDLSLSIDHDDNIHDGYCSDHIGLLDAVDAHILFSVSST